MFLISVLYINCLKVRAVNGVSLSRKIELAALRFHLYNVKMLAKEGCLSFWQMVLIYITNVRKEWLIIIY